MWVLALSLVLLGVICFIADKWMRKTGRLKSKKAQGDSSDEHNHHHDHDHHHGEMDVCCGAHEVCDKEKLLVASKNIVYYDDEELDTYKHTAPDNYSEEAIEQFSEVFYTLHEEDVAGWVRSLQAREIELPESLRDEVLLIVRERRMGQ